MKHHHFYLGKTHDISIDGHSFNSYLYVETTVQELHHHLRARVGWSRGVAEQARSAAVAVIHRTLVDDCSVQKPGWLMIIGYDSKNLINDERLMISSGNCFHPSYLGDYFIQERGIPKINQPGFNGMIEGLILNTAHLGM